MGPGATHNAGAEHDAKELRKRCYAFVTRLSPGAGPVGLTLCLTATIYIHALQTTEATLFWAGCRFHGEDTHLYKACLLLLEELEGSTLVTKLYQVTETQ